MSPYVRLFFASLFIVVVGCTSTETMTSTSEDRTEPVAAVDTLDREPFIPSKYFISETDSSSYALGVNVGQGLMNQLIEIGNIRAFATGVQDAFNKTDSIDFKIDEPTLQAMLTTMQQQLMVKQQEQKRKLQTENLEASNRFLEENKSKDGVTTTESGLQYRIVKQGDGVIPTTASTVVVHYSGRLLDGTEFDSSYRRGQPASFPVTGVIRGWTEGLQLMKTGSIYEFYIPPTLGYGVQGNQRIPPNALLIFEVELIEVKNQ